MDVDSLIAFLAPFLPHLVKAGHAAAEAAGEDLGKGSWEWAKRLWGRLRPGVDADAELRAAVLARAAGLDDEKTLSELAAQFRRLLAADPALNMEVGELWRQAQAAEVTTMGSVQAIGDRSMAVGKVSGGILSTGDNAVFERARDE